MGRLTSPLFSQERELFLVLRPTQAWRNPGGMLSRFQASGNRCRKKKRNRDLESVQDSQIEWKKISFRTKRYSLKKKADHAFQGEFAAQARIFEAQSELDRREWRIRDADITLYETGMQLQSQRLELYRANQLTDQTRREKSWLCEELEMRNRTFQEDRARN